MVMEVHVTGTVESVVFSNADTGFAVLTFLPDGAAAPITAVGLVTGPAPGQPLRLTGRFENSGKWGREFKFASFTVIRPTSPDSIRRYLGSGMIKGIGPVTAERIVDSFGETTLDVMDNEIDELQQVSGIGKKTLAKIKDAWNRERETRELTLFCQENELPMFLAPRIFKAYGSRAEGLIKANPYRLALDVKGVGFLTADRLAGKLGIDHDHPGRAEAGLLHILEQAGSEGHVALPRDLLLDRTSRLLDRPEEELDKELSRSVDHGRLVVDTKVADDPFVYSRAGHRIETELSAAMSTLVSAPGTVRAIKGDKAIEWVEKRLDLQLAQAQQEAVVEAIASKVMVITGGPGTGKTTIIKAILEILSALNKEVMLAAPTGRASKRMSEATGFPAMTIHRMLKYNPIKADFEHDANNPLSAEAIIVDEASMLDQWLANKLLAGMRTNAHLILVGDSDQLPSVGPGNVLADVIASGKVPTVMLTEIFRQDAAGLIVNNAHRINAGFKPELPKGEALSDFYFLAEDDPARLQELVCDLVTRRLPSKFGFDPLRDIQVISPMHRGDVGVQALNAQLQARLNPNGPSYTRKETVFKVGDKVMQTVNDYDKEVFNGDIGSISGMEGPEVTVRFPEGEKIYKGEDLGNLVLAYAISVHKSQGSEYPAVVLPLSSQHYIMLQRNLLYTAVTRAKKLVILAGSYKALHQALANDRPARRFTGLTRRLEQMEGKRLV
jgi:exodeoxyribonuclease V alpha subunit